MPSGPATDLAELLATAEVLVVAGAGGVGKTTVAAATAVGAVAATERSVLVVTVDPARRLASALGLADLGNDPVEVSRDRLVEAGVEPVGRLYAAMLDTKTAWDDLVRRHAPDRATVDAILANPLYADIASTFVQSHDYVAADALYEFQRSGEFDLIIVDTPPARRAIDFLEAPARMADFFGSALLRWLTDPARSRLAEAAARPFQLVADRILGARFLADIAEFFTLFGSMYDGFVERSNAVSAVLGDASTHFVIVTTNTEDAAGEAMFLGDELARRSLELAAIVSNRVLPDHLLDEDAAALARSLTEPSARSEAIGRLPAELRGLDHLELVVDELVTTFLTYRDAALAAAVWARRLDERSALRPSVPLLATESMDLAALAWMGRVLLGSEPYDRPIWPT